MTNRIKQLTESQVELAPLVTYTFSKGKYKIYAIFNPNNRWFIEGAMPRGERTYSSGNIGRADYQSGINDLHTSDIITLDNTCPVIKRKFQDIAFRVHRDKKVYPLTEYKAIALLQEIFPKGIENKPPVILFRTISNEHCALGKESKKGLYNTKTDEVLFVQSFMNDDTNPHSPSRISRKENPLVYLFDSAAISESNSVKFKSFRSCLKDIGGIENLDDMVTTKIERTYGYNDPPFLYDTVLFKWWDVPDTQKFFSTLKKEYKRENKSDLDWMLRSLEI